MRRKQGRPNSKVSWPLRQRFTSSIAETTPARFSGEASYVISSGLSSKRCRSSRPTDFAKNVNTEWLHSRIAAGISSDLKLPLRDIQFRSGENGSVVPYIAVFDNSE